MYRLKQAHPSIYRIFEKKKGPIDVPGSLILRPMFAAHPYNHFCTEYPPRMLALSTLPLTESTVMFSALDRD